MSAEANTRDHLANERTFLAWFRTAISLLGFGILIAKLRFIEAGTEVAPGAGIRSTHLGLAFAVGGLLTLALAAWQFYRTKRLIDDGAYQSPVQAILAFSVVAFVLGLGSVVYLATLSK